MVANIFPLFPIPQLWPNSHHRRPFRHFFFCHTFLLSFLYNLPTISAEICTTSGQDDDPGSADGVHRLRKPAKQCPDFKDDLDQNACCPSQITNGAFFCCTEGYKAEIDSQLAAEARRKFISSHIPELVLCLLAFLLFLFLLCSFLCRRSRFCPLLHRRKANSNRRHSSPSFLDSTAESAAICRPSAFNRPHSHNHRLAETFTRPSYQFHRPAPPELPLFSSAIAKEYDAPPPYNLAIATPVPPPPPQPPMNVNFLEENEEQQNRLNAQREEQGRNE